MTREDRLILKKLIEALEGNIQSIPGRSGAGSPTPKPAGKRVYGKSAYDPDHEPEENYDSEDHDPVEDEEPVATSRAFGGIS
tara:strand:- start:1456 stop:1701 length:246 start_codon:yes stop_codon:yes gene_type:complete